MVVKRKKTKTKNYAQEIPIAGLSRPGLVGVLSSRRLEIGDKARHT